jgi:hypothetical protein
MPYQIARCGAGNNPVAKFLEMISWRTLLLTKTFDIKRELRGPCSAEEAKKYSDEFFDRDWQSLDQSQQDEIREIFSQIDKDLLYPFSAWLEDIRAKMGISNVGNKGRKMKRSSGGIEGFLKALKKDLKEKGV